MCVPALLGDSPSGGLHGDGAVRVSHDGIASSQSFSVPAGIPIKWKSVFR